MYVYVCVCARQVLKTKLLADWGYCIIYLIGLLVGGILGDWRYRTKGRMADLFRVDWLTEGIVRTVDWLTCWKQTGSKYCTRGRLACLLVGERLVDWRCSCTRDRLACLLGVGWLTGGIVVLKVDWLTCWR